MDSNGIMPTYNIGGSDGFGGGMGIWAFLIFALLLGGNGGFFGGNAGNSNAIQADVNRGFDNQNLQAQTRDILTAVTSGTAQTQATSNANTSNIINSIKDGNAALIREFGTVESALTALGGSMQQCCCNTLRAIDGVNYNAAMNTASINATTTAQTQKILDALAQNKIDAQKNGADIVGMTASTTITTADTEVRTLNISGIVRVLCSEGFGILTLVNSGLEITSSNVELDVEYLG